jgi:RES domain-containing protein
MRLVAGGPLSNDILKCQLKPIDYADYTVAFTDEEKRRLEAVFPLGVCDWSKPGVHQQVNRTWLSYGPAPENRY